MKPTRLFLSALAMTALASCSSSEDIPTPTPQMIDTYLSITATAGEVKTKAPENETGTGNENFINKLTALVFYADGRFAASKDTLVQWGKDEKTSIDRITNIKVKVAAMAEGETSPTALKVMLIANADLTGISDLASLSTTTFGDISKLIASEISNGIPAANATYLPMSSNVIAVNVNAVTAGAQNWIADDGTVVSESTGDHVITMYRYVARVQLESLTTNFTDNNTGLCFRLDSVALANVSSASLYDKGEEGDDLYKAETPFFRGMPKGFVRKDYYIADGTYEPEALSVSYTDNGTKIVVANNIPANFGATGVPMFYAFEYLGNKETIQGAPDQGGEINPMMILAGTFVNADGSNHPTYTETRYFRIPIKVSEAANATYGVARNTIYKVKATLTGEGTKNPDENMLNAMVNFKITVDNWTVINQVENDIN